VEKVRGNVLAPDSLLRAVDGCAWVFHLAAVYALWLPRMEAMQEVNVQGTRNVLQAALDQGVERVVYTSSIAVFGGQGPDRDATEESPFALGDTGNLYAVSKYEAHKVALSFVERGLDVTITAPCGPIGPGDVGPTPTGRFLLALVNAPVCPLVDTVTNFGDVRDMARGHVLAARKGKTGESYLLGTENYRYHQLADMATEITGIRKPRLRIPDSLIKVGAHAMKKMADWGIKRPPLLTPDSVIIGQRCLRADCTKARSELGMPQNPVKNAVRDALVWFARNGHVSNERLRRKLETG
jgi:dihydroflavonol-4-reductase